MAGKIEGRAGGQGRPILDQTSDVFERLLRAAGERFDRIDDPAGRLMDRVARLRAALDRDPGLLQRLQQGDPAAFRQLGQIRDALQAMLPSLGGAELRAAEEAIQQIDTMTMATTQKPIVPPSGWVRSAQ